MKLIIIFNLCIIIKEAIHDFDSLFLQSKKDDSHKELLKKAPNKETKL
jgi:hypothetical protein